MLFEPLETRVVLDSTVVFNEILYHPAGNEDSLEWIELFNQMTVDMDLSRWRLAGAVDYNFAEGTIVPGKSHMVVAINPQELENQTGYSGALGPYSGRLDNGGEELLLLNNNDRIMSRLDYRDGGDWPVGPDGMGFTLAKQEEFLSTEPAEHWATSSQLGGTPGEVNFVEHTGPTSEILVEPGDTARVLIPSNNSLGLAWTQTSFNDASWTAGPTGVGYEVGAGTSVAYRNLVGAPGSAALPGPLGHDFVVNSTVTVTQLGVFDSGADGLSRTLTAELWSRSSNSGTKLADLKFTSSDPGTLVDSNRFKQLNPALQLSPGDYTIVAHGYGSSERAGHEGFGGPDSSFKTLDDGGGAISFVGTSRLGTTAGSFPSIPDGGTANNYSAGTFRFTTSLTGSEIATNIESQIRGVNTTAYVRIPFNVNSTENFQLMTFSMQYNDGFVAYLNGTEVVRRNAPASVTWNSAAVVDNTLVTHEVIDLSANLSALRNGSNVLAVHGLNAGLNDQRFFVLPELEIFSSGFQPELAINEVSAGDTTDFFVEIANGSNVSQPVAGYVVASSSGIDYVIPSQTIAAGGWLSISATELGFTPADGDSLFLLSPSRGQLLGARNVTGRLRGRSDQHDGRWLYPDVATPGAANSFDFHDEIVINEILYHPFSELPSNVDVDLSERETTTTLLTTGDRANYFIPTNGTLGTSWQSTTFNDASWSSGPTGLGFEVSGATDVIAYENLPGAVGSAMLGGPLGHDFVVNSTITVDRLGVFDSGANGVKRTLTAELWSRNGNTGTELVQLQFTSDSPGTLTGSNRFKSLSTPLVLGPGDYTIVAHGYGANELAGHEGFGGPSAAFKNLNDGNGAISFVGTSRLGTTPGAFPSILGAGPVNFYSAGTFRFSSGGTTLGEINTDIGNVMHQVNSTAYVRFEFTTPALEGVSKFDLKMKYDDGFIAYLNGTEVVRRNAPTSATWNSAATTSAHVSVDFESIDISNFADQLQAGNNVLAIQGLNFSANDGDFLLVPELKVTSGGAVQSEWIELYNRGATTVDLTGWKLEEAVSYEFPAGTTMTPGAYLVIAKDADQIAFDYPGIDVLGDFSGRLSNRDELIRLSDANKNPADEVHYFQDGYWPGLADGGGSSLELRDPDADNSRPGAWAASDESTKSTWNTFSYTATSDAAETFSTMYHEFVMGLMDDGEILIDDILVRKSPAGANQQIITNSSFHSDSIGSSPGSWRVIGNHFGTVVQDPDDPSNKVLRMTATGMTNDLHNHAEITTTQILGHTEYEISFRAKWLGGNNRLYTRLYYNHVPESTLLPVPPLNGTPGVRNSRYQSNIGPTYENFIHSPVVPDAGEDVTITAIANDPDGVSSARVYWSVNQGAFQNAAMVVGADGLITGTIPGQSTSSIVQFYITATDGHGVSSTFPAAGSDSRALYKVRDGQASLGRLHNFRIIMLPSEVSAIHVNNQSMSNHRIGGTVLDNEETVFYDIGVRLSGASNTRPHQHRAGYSVRFHEDNLFRGIHPTVTIDRFQREEIFVKHLNNHADGIPSMYNDVIRLVGPASDKTGTATMRLAKFDRVYLDSQFINGGEGGLWEKELAYRPKGVGSGGVKNAHPYGHPTDFNWDIKDLGDDKDTYRIFWQQKNHRDRDDFSRIIELNKAFSLTGSALDTATEAVIDVDQWLRVAAMWRIASMSDMYSNPSGGPGGSWNHNFLLYERPEDGKAIVLPWDMDSAFAQPVGFTIIGNQNLAKVIQLPGNLRRYYGHLHDLISTTWNPSYAQRWASHFQSLIGTSMQHGVNYISDRGNHILSLLPSLSPFEITTHGGTDFSVSDSTVTITGKASYRVKNIFLEGLDVPLSPTWTDSKTWEVVIPLQFGANTLTFQAYDYQGNLADTDSIRVTTTVGTPVQAALRVSELMFNQADADDAEYIELLNLSQTETIDLTGVQFTNGINYTFTGGSLPPGERVVVARDVVAFQLAYGGGINVVGPFGSGRLSNSGETIAFSDSIGFPIQSFSYSDLWFPGTDGGGYSLTVANETDPLTDLNVMTAWRPSNHVGGSPGSGDVAVAPGSVVINEVMANSANDPDGDWIELANISASAVEIGDWFLSNTDTNFTLYQIESGTVIPAGGYLVLTENEDFGASFTLDENGDSVFLTGGDSAGNLLGYRDQQELFTATMPAESIGRYSKSDGSADFVRLSAATKNVANATPAVGPVVINEIMYHPAAGEQEFLELHNVSSSSVNLSEGANNPWRITGTTSYAFPVGETIPAGGYGLLVEGTDGGNAVAEAVAFRSAHSVDAAVPIFIYTPLANGKLDNNGGTVSLEMPSTDADSPQSYVLIDSVDYLDTAPWPDTADGLGASLMRRIANDYGNDVANWQPGTIGGTPAGPNHGLDVTPPTVPTNLTGRVHNSTQVRLFWTPSTDEETGVESYNVYRNDVLIGSTPVPLFTDNVAIDMPLRYEVSAENPTGSESGFSSSFSTGGQLFEFQQGSLPDDAYSGAEDTQLLEELPNANFGTDSSIRVDGDFAGGSSMLTSNLIGYWPFDDDVNDESNEQHDLVLQGNANITTGGGLIGDALELPTNTPGTGGNAIDYAERPVHDSEYDFGAAEFTIQVWVNYEDTSGESVLMEQFDSGGGPGWTLTSFPQNGKDFLFYADGTPSFSVRSNQPVPAGSPADKWIHVVVRRSGDDFNIFVDGDLAGAVTNSTTISSAFNNLLLGRRNAGDIRGFGFRGKLDEVAIWSRSLSDMEIDSLYNDGHGTDVTAPEGPSTGQDVSALLKWDISTIPSGSVVTTASMTLDVINNTSGTYQVRQVLRDWSESGATWNQYAAGKNWQTPGAMGAADRGATVSTVSSTGTGFYTANLNADGLALVQSWVNGTQPNYGVLIANSTTTDGLGFSSNQSSVSTDRPKLTVTTSVDTNPGITADFNNDQLIDAEDIDLLNRAIAVSHHDVALDLDSNTGTDTADVDKLVRNILSTNYGDTDLDEDIDTNDLTTAIINFTSAGGSGKGWATGDTDGDGDVDTSDLTTAIINFTGARMSGALGTTSNIIDRSFVLPALKRSDSDTSADISTARAEVITQSPTDDDRVADPNKSQTGDLPRPIDDGQSTRPNSKRHLDGVLAEEIDWLS